MDDSKLVFTSHLTTIYATSSCHSATTITTEPENPRKYNDTSISPVREARVDWPTKDFTAVKLDTHSASLFSSYYHRLSSQELIPISQRCLHHPGIYSPLSFAAVASDPFSLSTASSFPSPVSYPMGRYLTHQDDPVNAITQGSPRYTRESVTSPGGTSARGYFPVIVGGTSADDKGSEQSRTLAGVGANVNS